MRLAACGIAIFAFSLPCFAEGPTFDVASVKMAAPDVLPSYTGNGGPGTNDPSRFNVPRVEMLQLLLRAFDVQTDQITGPAWLRDDPRSKVVPPAYAIAATMPADTTKEQFQKMLQNLLIERFHLVFHRETRNFPGYALVVDKGGPKFKEVTPTLGPDSGTPLDARAALRSPRGADGFPSAPGSRMISEFHPGGQERTKYQERTMAQFLSNLGALIRSSQGKGVDSPTPRVVDRTGLTGTYTFILEFYNASMANLPSPFAGAAAADTGNASPPTPSDPGGTDIFTAIQKQLGLRLDKMPDVPMDIIVVDSVDKVPTED